MRKRPSCLIWMSAVAGREPARKKMTHSGVLSFNFSNFLNVFFRWLFSDVRSFRDSNRGAQPDSRTGTQ